MRPNKLPKVLTENEQQKILNLPNHRYVTAQRNYTLIRLMLNTGLRLSEATGLRWNDINLTSGKLEVIEGKGKKDRILWLSLADLEMLKDWRDRQTNEAGIALKYVFTSMSQDVIGNKLDNRYVQDMIKRYAEKAGIDKNISPHTL